ncbi:MAG TPA: PKD domain-containing protein [Terriglobia bacterium]|nr:PKD domain-containing protein [Terriglobia bacterium]
MSRFSLVRQFSRLLPWCLPSVAGLCVLGLAGITTALWGPGLPVAAVLPAAFQVDSPLHNSQLSVAFDRQSGLYAIRAGSLEAPVLQSRVGAEVNHRWLRSSDYPQHEEAQNSFEDNLGSGEQDTITFRGLSSEPDLVCILRLYGELPYGTVEVKVVNHTSKAVSVEAIRDVDAIGSPMVNLGAPESADRVMFEVFTEDPSIRIGGLDQAPKGTYAGVRDGLIYSLSSKQSLLLAALTSNRFMTALHLKVQQSPTGAAAIGSFTVDSTGTTEAVLQRDDIAPDQRVELGLPVEPGKELSSERVMFAAGPDYHAQLLAYGAAVRRLYHARVSSPAPMGWWSWTAFYAGVNEGEVLTNAQWLAQHLKSLGYNYCHIDEGYDYARGEYVTASATHFPNGMRSLGYKITNMGLTFALWTAPFEVSQRAWVYEHHPDWLVKDAQGRPIRIDYVNRHVDPLYALDTTNPGAQQYLRETYRVLTREWGVRYIKLDFMDSSAIEGYYYRPHTTALEAERIGLKIIREAVGEEVLLDKDGSPMLNPVGLVDEGRIAPDTGHSFEASRDAATNIAARFYMNRNFYISDPDAFSVSTEVEPQQAWHESKKALTLDEAEVQIVLAAAAGGMYEIGDDLPTLAATPDRLALVENRDLLRMVKLGRAATPVDLMSFSTQDEMPSVYFLQEDARQSMAAVFNWTEGPRSHTLELSSLGLPPGHPYEAYNVLDANAPVAIEGGSVAVGPQPPHSVRLIKIIDTSLPASAPAVSLDVPNSAETGEAIHLRATPAAEGGPVLSYDWDFGDGTTASGSEVSHAYTRAAVCDGKLTVDGVDGIPAERHFKVAVQGQARTRFDLRENRRYVEPGGNQPESKKGARPPDVKGVLPPAA